VKACAACGCVLLGAGVQTILLQELNYAPTEWLCQNFENHGLTVRDALCAVCLYGKIRIG